VKLAAGLTALAALAALAAAPPPPCGNLGVTFDSLTYFEFHAVENPRRFAFVSAGQDAPLFDETKIKFLP